jgi:hypothetical protein
MSSTYPGFEFRDFVIRQSIRLGDDGNEVDFSMQPTHKLNIEGLQATRHFRHGIYDALMVYSRMTSGLDEVQAGMDAIVHDLLPIDAVFLFEIGVETGFNVLDNRFPA